MDRTVSDCSPLRVCVCVCGCPCSTSLHTEVVLCSETFSFWCLVFHWVVGATSSQNSVSLLSTDWPPDTKPKLHKHWMCWGHYYYYTHNVHVFAKTRKKKRFFLCCFFTGPIRSLAALIAAGRAKRQLFVSAFLLKPLAESFQSSRTFLWFGCWSKQAAVNLTNLPALFKSLQLSSCQTDDRHHGERLL